MSQGLAQKKPYEKKTFASDTLAKIKSRLKYYRRVLAYTPNTENGRERIARIQRKYEHDMLVRKLLKRAVRHLYE